MMNIFDGSKIKTAGVLIPMLLLSFAAEPLDDVPEKTGAYYYHALGFKGAGVLMGIIDNSINLSYYDYRNPDGSTRCLNYLDYERGDMDSSDINSILRDKYPDNRLYNYDTVFNLSPDGHAHGDPVASLALGNGSSVGAVDFSGKYTGIAPESDFIFGVYSKSSYYESLAYYLRFIDSAASALGRPWVVNMSLSSGPQQLIDSLTGQGKSGKCVIVASGNVPSDNYYKMESESGGTDSTVFQYGPFDFGKFKIEYGGDTLRTFRTTADISCSASEGSYTVEINSPGGNIASWGLSEFPRRNGFYSQVFLAGGDSSAGDETLLTAQYERCLLYRKSDTVYSFSLEARSDSARPFQIKVKRENINSYTETEINFNKYNSVLSAADEYYVYPDTTLLDRYKALAPLANTASAVTVASYYDSVLAGDPPDALKGGLTYYSSAGPSLSGIQKPDITAPGHGVIMLMPGGVMADSIHDYTRYGTSFAAPVAAGAAALLLERYPYLDAAEIKDTMALYAISDNQTGAVPNNLWGYGKLNLASGETAMESETTGFGSGVTEAGNYPNPFNPETVISFTSSDNFADVTIYGTKGRRLFRKTFTADGEMLGRVRFSFSPESTASGIMICRIETGSGTEEFRMLYCR
ncbi:MAG: S8 family peptidase [Fibrobacterota bacterium]